MNAYVEFLKPDECVLLLVDIQKVMLGPCQDAEGIPRNVETLIDVAGIFGIPIFFSVHNAEKLGGFLPELLAKVPNPVVLNKVEFSCFENATIAQAVARLNRRTLIVAGIETHVCVFHTSVNALRLGYTVHVAADAVASRSRFNCEIGLRRMEKAGVVISSTEMIVFELLNRAGTPEFRSALPILKKF